MRIYATKRDRVVHGKYGTFEIGVPYHDGGSWFRSDLYHPNNTNELPVWERVFCAGRDDFSAPHCIYPDGYNSRCSCCYLNIGHTKKLHQERTKGR